MTDFTHIDQFIGDFFAGLGLLMVGGLNLALSRARVGVRALATLCVAGAVVGACAAWSPDALQRVAAVLALAVGPAVLLGSGRVVAVGVAVVRFAGRPAARWSLVAVAGVAVVAAAGVNFTRSEEAAHDRAMTELEMLVARPPLSELEDTAAQTDRGYAVKVRRAMAERDGPAISGPEDRVLTNLGYKNVVIRRGPATDHSNCHGWVFSGGRFWVGGEAVPQILADNAYAEVTDPRPGDLAIYRDDAGAVGHTAIVRYAADGMSPIVESKWAWMGVFLHPVDRSAYGTKVTYYRSPRSGHVLAGLE